MDLAVLTETGRPFPSLEVFLPNNENRNRIMAQYQLPFPFNVVAKGLPLVQTMASGNPEKEKESSP